MSTNNSRDARRNALRETQTIFSNYLRRFTAYAHNAVTFENLGDLPKRYLMRILINYGAIAYDKQTRLYLRFVPIGYDIYGLPERYQLYGADGYTVTRYPDEVVILRINDIQEPLRPYLLIKAKRITQYDNAILQNLDAIRTMTIYETENDSNVLSMVNEMESKRLGATVFFKNKKAFSGTDLKVSSTGAQYLIDKLQEARQKELNELYATIGTASANTDKRERVQGLEVNASLSYAYDSLYLNIDTFNYDAKVGGIPIRMRPNTSITDLWEKENDKTDNNENKNDTKTEETI